MKIRTDRGGEFTSTEFEKFLEEQGILHEKTPPDTPQLNDVAKKRNGLVHSSINMWGVA